MDLEQRIRDLNQAVEIYRGTPLSAIELAVIQGSCAGHTYEEIAVATRYSASYLSRTFCPQLWHLLSTVCGTRISKKNLLTSLELMGLEPSSKTHHTHQVQLVSHIDWGEAVDVSGFHGRINELTCLEDWILEQHCRLITLVGMGGIGKTALSVKLSHNIQDRFEFLIWRSLRNAPPLEVLLRDLVSFLSEHQDTKPEVSKVIHCLRQSRCLMILDNLETLLDAEHAGQFRRGFEAYGDLLRAFAEVDHQSCVVLTSREQPAEVAILEGDEAAVRSLRLDGSPEAAQFIMQTKKLIGTAEQKKRLGDLYGNNPLALKIVATSIQEFCGCEIGDFLQENTFIFNGIRRLLDQHFQRLPELEQTIMFWLAINRGWTSLMELQTDIIPAIPKPRLLEGLEALRFRCLIEQQGMRFTQQPVVMEYVTDRLIDAVAQEINQGILHHLKTHALLKAEAADYIRKSQQQFILEPLLTRIGLKFGHRDAIANHLRQILERTQQETPPSLGYDAGNLINLLSYLQADLTGLNLSGLLLRQLYLADTPMHRVNLSYASCDRTIFAESLADVLGLNVSPDGTQLAITGLSGMLYLYDLSTRQWGNSWAAHRGWSFTGGLFTPDGATLLTGGLDGRIVHWDAVTGDCLQEWQTDSPVWCLAVTSDGQWLASGHENNTVRLWNLQTHEPVNVLPDQGGTVRAVAFHPQKPHLATGSNNAAIKLWNYKTGDCWATLTEHTDAIWGLDFSTQGTYLASASSDGSAKVWDSITGQCIHTFQMGSQQIRRAQFSPDDRLLASTGLDSIIRLWDIASGKLLRTLPGHRGGVWAMTFSPDGQTLISGGEAAQVKIWQVESGHCIKTLQGKTLSHHCIRFNSQGTRFASSGDDAQLRLWSAETGECLQTYLRQGTRIITIAFHRDRDYIATGEYEGSVRVWNLQGQCLQTLKGHKNPVFSVVFHPIQPLLVSGGIDSTIRFWHIETGNLVHTIELQAGKGYVLAIAFHPHGHLFASGGEDRVIRLWDDASKTVVRELSGHLTRVWCLAFHPQGELLASGSHDGTVKLWQIRSGDCLATFNALSGVPMAVGFSADGQLLAAGCDRAIHIWEVATGGCLRILQGHNNTVSSLDFHPHNNSMLISASYDETIRIWNTETGECLKVLRPDRIYERLNIQGVTGLSAGQKAVLKQLGAVEMAY